ncbi:hypothetical protein CPB83DRAFT_863954 [Crepidotus variabilis]|uniref:Ubiquitin 3 binding protein But2 C-terminal domain-containing protein n=1 Tax=Crepidotus variabilis TaxID=179855 RepID=A0A9P6E5H1_9AGAR|nr:hypothetical protein CPB83DRAFT_863954 [Crepidotus variabilis]
MPDQGQHSLKEDELYRLLPTTDSDSDRIQNAHRLSPPIEIQTLVRDHKHSFIDYAIFAILISTVVDLVLLGSLVISHTPAVQPKHTWHEIYKLPFRNSYVNFDKLYQNKSFPHSDLRPITNHARAFYQVSSKNGEKDQVMNVWSQERLTRGGMMPEYGRRLIVNSTMSTFAQFQVMDYGMEECAIAISIPAPGTDALVTSSGSTMKASIDVYKYPSISTPMDFSRLSWSTKPSSRRVFLFSLPVSYGATRESKKFRCLSQSAQTFEFACADCSVDVVGHGHQLEGLFMKQYQTV